MSKLTDFLLGPWDCLCIILGVDDRREVKNDVRKFKDGVDNILHYEPFWDPGLRWRKRLKTQDSRPYWDETWWPTDDELKKYYKRKYKERHT